MSCLLTALIPYPPPNCPDGLLTTPRVQFRSLLRFGSAQTFPRALNTPLPCLLQGLCFNGSAFVLYLSAAIVDATSVSPERDGHNFNSWAASSVSEPSRPPWASPSSLRPSGIRGTKLSAGKGSTCRSDTLAISFLV